jgi:hypothetical protein
MAARLAGSDHSRSPRPEKLYRAAPGCTGPSARRLAPRPADLACGWHAATIDTAGPVPPSIPAAQLVSSATLGSTDKPQPQQRRHAPLSEPAPGPPGDPPESGRPAPLCERRPTTRRPAGTLHSLSRRRTRKKAPNPLHSACQRLTSPEKLPSPGGGCAVGRGKWEHEKRAWLRVRARLLSSLHL